mgnify:CR=1 FL=1
MSVVVMAWTWSADAPVPFPSAADAFYVAFYPLLALGLGLLLRMQDDRRDWGNLIDVVAPGSDIYSSYINGSANNYFSFSSGTSMASPHVAGAAALLLQNGTAPENVDTALKANAQAFAKGQEDFATTIDGHSWTQPVFPYQVKCLESLQAARHSMSSEARASLDKLLDGTGCEAMFSTASD